MAQTAREREEDRMSEAGIEQRDASAGTPHRRNFAQRFVGALRLDAATYDEIAQTPDSLAQAAGVAVAAGLLKAVATGAAASAAGMVSAVSVFAFWPIGAFLIWIGCRQQVGFVVLLRTVGFAMAPLVLVALDVVPIASFHHVVDLLATALFLATLVVGTRQAVRTTTGNAALLCAPAFLMLIFLPMVVGYVASKLGV
jgi:hypothetical protein